MKYKVLAFDIDGTLTNSRKEITPETRAAILRAADMGCTIVIATGRPPQGVVRYVNELELPDKEGYVLALNGGLLENCSTGTAISRTFLPMEYYHEICAIAKEYKVNLMTYQGDDIISENIDDKYVEIESRINGLGVKQVDNLEKYITFEVPKFLMLGDGDYLAEVEKKVHARLSDRLDVYRSEPFFLEVLPKGINKAATLEKLLNHLGCRREELMAFGDGYNDISMLKYAGMGVVMGNANDTVKKEGDYIAPSNDENGIVDVLNKFVLD